MTEVGGEGACYVDPTDIDDIRRGILRVWQDETYRNKLVRAGRANAQLYSIERVTARYVALYESLAAT
jgi:glycosyltransferase involved in cell wall biosynthesis